MVFIVYNNLNTLSHHSDINRSRLTCLEQRKIYPQLMVSKMSRVHDENS